MKKKKLSYQSKQMNEQKCKHFILRIFFFFFRRMRLELLGRQTADEDSCTICFDRKADVMLYPCKHE